jgi:hypothetical protein
VVIYRAVWAVQFFPSVLITIVPLTSVLYMRDPCRFIASRVADRGYPYGLPDPREMMTAWGRVFMIEPIALSDPWPGNLSMVAGPRMSVASPGKITDTLCIVTRSTRESVS